MDQVQDRERGKFYFFLGYVPEYHSARKLEFEFIWQKNPISTGHRADSLITFLPPTKSGV
jgi:hypothetical protein